MYVGNFCCEALLLHFAVSPMDYVKVSTILNFPACGTRQCVNVGIVNDLVDEAEEEFGVSLERTPNLNGGIILDPVNGKIFIQDDGKYSNRVCLYAAQEHYSYTSIDFVLSVQYKLAYFDN